MVCLSCDSITDNPKFCSRSCAATFNNKKYPKRKPALKSSCLWCGCITAKGSAKYCSRACQTEYEYHIYINKWLLGIESGTQKAGLDPTDQIRRYLKNKYNNSCSKCSWAEANPINDVIHLEIEHIDGDCANNREYNLDLLCPNCHSLTPTYKYLNRGNSKRKLRVK